MLFNEVFEDLGEFVAAYRNRICREGMLLYTDTLYQEGTVLALEITLAESLPLIRGTAGVVQLMKAPEDSGAQYAVVLEFLQLDEQSDGFVARLTERLRSEGDTTFNVDQYMNKGRRGTRRTAATEEEAATQNAESDSLSVVEDVTRPPFESARRSRRRRSGRWLRLTACTVLAAAGGAVVVLVVVPRLEPLLGSDTPAPVVAGTTISPTSLARATPLSGLPGQRRPSEGSADRRDGLQAGQPAGRPATRIDRVLWTDAVDVTEVWVEADGALDEAAVGHFLMGDEPQPRLVLYLYGLASNDLAYRTAVGGPRLDAIRVWYHADKSPRQLHIVFDLAHPGITCSQPSIEGGRVRITLSGDGGPGAQE